MQEIEKFFGLKADDFRQIMPNLKHAVDTGLKKYR